MPSNAALTGLCHLMSTTGAERRPRLPSASQPLMATAAGTLGKLAICSPCLAPL